MSMDDAYWKYLKYKNKYVSLKAKLSVSNLNGGGKTEREIELIIGKLNAGGEITEENYNLLKQNNPVFVNDNEIESITVGTPSDWSTKYKLIPEEKRLKEITDIYTKRVNRMLERRDIKELLNLGVDINSLPLQLTKEKNFILNPVPRAKREKHVTAIWKDDEYVKFCKKFGLYLEGHEYFTLNNSIKTKYNFRKESSGSARDPDTNYYPIDTTETTETTETKRKKQELIDKIDKNVPITDQEYLDIGDLDLDPKYQNMKFVFNKETQEWTKVNK